jgi:hypothetical protein
LQHTEFFRTALQISLTGCWSGQSRRWAASAPIVYLYERICRPGTLFIIMLRFSPKRFKFAAGLLALDIILFTSTNATKAPSFAVIVGFGLLVLTIYAVIAELLALAGLYGLKLVRRRQLTIYLSVLVGGLIALQSIGELARRDVVVWLPLMFISYVYSAYVKPDRRNLES